MDKTLHNNLVAIAWQLKDIGCAINDIQAKREFLSAADRSLLQEAVGKIDALIDLITGK